MPGRWMSREGGRTQCPRPSSSKTRLEHTAQQLSPGPSSPSVGEAGAGPDEVPSSGGQCLEVANDVVTDELSAETWATALS